MITITSSDVEHTKLYDVLWRTVYIELDCNLHWFYSKKLKNKVMFYSVFIYRQLKDNIYDNN